MQRFYVSSLGATESELSIDDPRIVHQVSKVLRMCDGDQMQLFNEDTQVLATLNSIDKRSITVTVTEAEQVPVESEKRITLYQAIPKKPALFELVVQKATELGVHKIVPLLSQRTEAGHLKKDRLHLIALEATEQCGGNRIPEITEPQKFADALIESTPGLLGHLGENTTPLSSIEIPAEASLFIGPEGGFTAEEAKAAQEAGVQLFSLGPRTLRTETAAIATLSHLLLD